MNKLYYTNPLVAAYMAREFKILIGQWDDEREVFFTKIGWLGEPLGTSSKGKYHIHPDSYHIFEPQVGDLCLKSTKSSCHYCGMDYLAQIEDEDELELWGDVIIKVIQRNNKPFFWPEREDV